MTAKTFKTNCKCYGLAFLTALAINTNAQTWETYTVSEATAGHNVHTDAEGNFYLYGNTVFKKTASGWENLSYNLSSSSALDYFSFTDLCVHQGQIHGKFLRSASSSNRVLALTDETWAIKGTTFNIFNDGSFDKLISYKSDIYTLGNKMFKYVRKYQDNAWVETGFTGNLNTDAVYAAFVYGGEMYVGTSYELVKYDGTTYTNLYQKVANYTSGEQFGDFSAFEQHNGELYVGCNIYAYQGGNNTSITPAVCKWNGTQLVVIGKGQTGKSIHHLKSFNNHLIVAGSFGSFESAEKTEYMAKWNGSTWSALATNTPHYSYEQTLNIAKYDGVLYINTTYGGRKYLSGFTEVVTSLEEMASESKKISVFPNPAEQQATIDGVNLQGYKVYNALGREILSGTSNTFGVADLAPGLYIIKAEDAQGKSRTGSFMKK